MYQICTIVFTEKRYELSIKTIWNILINIKKKIPKIDMLSFHFVHLISRTTFDVVPITNTWKISCRGNFFIKKYYLV